MVLATRLEEAGRCVCQCDKRNTYAYVLILEQVMRFRNPESTRLIRSTIRLTFSGDVLKVLTSAMMRITAEHSLCIS